MTRPDITFAISQLDGYNANPKWEHWLAVKCVMRCFKETITHNFICNKPPQLKACCDADYANDSDGRKSISGYCVILGSGAVSWCSKTKTTNRRYVDANL